MWQNGLKILLRAIVGHGPKTGDLPSVWLETCGSLPYQPDALARVAASPSQGLAGSKAWRGQRLRGVKPCSGLRKAGRRPRTGFAGPFKGAGPLFGHRDLESRSPGRRSSGRAVSSLFEDALGHADVLSQFTRPGQGTIDATNQMVDAIGMIQAEDRGLALVLPRQESFASLHILTRRASEGSEALPSLARRVRMSFFGARVIIVVARCLVCGKPVCLDRVI